jgi:hypothetical protein
LGVAYDAATIAFLVCCEVAFPRMRTHDTGGLWWTLLLNHEGSMTLGLLFI